MLLPKNRKLIPRAKELRRDMTPHERKLWFLFLRNYPVKFYRQRVIDSFIVDFYCSPAKLVIEIDGSQHYTESGQQYDLERTAILSSHGLRILRFSNGEIDQEFDAVCQAIHQAVQAATPH